MQPEPSWRARSLDLPFQSPPRPLYRIARSRNASAWTSPDWSFVAEDGTFGNRFDDADGYFRVIYAGSSPLTCFVETLARYRQPPNVLDLLAALNNIENAGDEEVTFATVPASWVSTRILGEAICTRTRFAHIYSSEWLSYLRRNLEPGLMAKRLNAVQDFDLALLGSQDRRLTQQIATAVYQGIARFSVESSGSRMTYFTTLFSYSQHLFWKVSVFPERGRVPEFVCGR